MKTYLTENCGKFPGNNICTCHCGARHDGDSEDA